MSSERETSPSLSDDIECGDLGLGDGLKPGGLPQLEKSRQHSDNHHNDTDCDATKCSCANSTNCESHDICFERSEESQHLSEEENFCEFGEDYENPHHPKYDCSQNPKCKVMGIENDAETMCGENCHDSNNSNVTNAWKCGSCGSTSPNNFPHFAEIPFGTSLRQHKKLLEAQLENIEKKRQHRTKQKSESQNTKNQECTNGKKCEEIERKLVSAQQELCELKQEFEACQKRLNAKYQAIAILQSQLEEKTEDHKSKEQKSKEITEVLVKEINTLQFQMDWYELEMLNSQQKWSERFDRICQENAVLREELDCRLEELRKYSAINMAVGRERDELLSLMDVQERLKYEKSRIASTEDLENYCTFTAAELAVLGACQCRVTSTEPCGCSHVAVSLRRDVGALSDQIDIYKERSEEAYATVNVYREAFDEQLDRNKQMTLRLAELSSSSLSKTTRAKAALKWLLGSVNSDDEPLSSPIVVNGESVKVDLKAMEKSGITEREVIIALTDMIHDRNNALSHQKLHNQILANKIKVLEEKVISSKHSDKQKC